MRRATVGVVIAVTLMVASGCNCGSADECGTGVECGPGAECSNQQGTFRCTCKAGFEGDGGTCIDVAASLSGLRWNLPCTSGSGVACYCSDPAPVSTALGGALGASYDVSLRFRGVVEQKTYSGGSSDGAYWQVGGYPANDSYNIYRLEISSPAQTFYLNRGTSSITQCWAVDYVQTVRVSAGATVRLTAQVLDGQEITNHGDAGTPLIVPGVAPDPDPFNGQFIQMDVVGITRVP